MLNRLKLVPFVSVPLFTSLRPTILEVQGADKRIAKLNNAWNKLQNSNRDDRLKASELVDLDLHTHTDNSFFPMTLRSPTRTLRTWRLS